ncbi:F0F1 ATP synthase subunit gamma [Puniceibacterium sediminis]|uniref:F-type H+-transporting ATPase subunit gamma n=1 Tax=Puniceibacterium sediminis TaxID=1608407 RepID=A0A238XYY3_9RHOB|nr:FoF1 ATP synthase subunit gamma [Puniceibacterium sediminis]SNR63788.1 F-type H+-transporting ATPase subunit gamma [Puniceibacterium sediminis]
MTERLADISARIDGIRQLGAVVNAMKGIAAARAHVARTQVTAVDSYAETVAGAMARILRPGDTDLEDPNLRSPGKTGLLVFCAEQGFAGAFSERVLDSIGPEHEDSTLFLIGTRGLSVATARGITPVWSAALPSHTPGIPKLADRITTQIYRAVTEGRINRLDVVFTGWVAGRPALLQQCLFPVDLTDHPSSAVDRPLMQLPEGTLIDSLGQDYFHAQVCKAALHAFAAENEARMEAMTSAGTQIARELETFEATLRRVRQEAITAEIIELGTGADAASGAR